MNKLEPIALKLVKKPHIPHVIMAAERGDGSYREETAKGIRNPDGSIVTPATPYFIASIDKLFTASVVLKLSEQGKIDIEKPAKNYLPETLVKGIHVYKGRDYSSDITVRNLLSHTSGLAGWLEDYPRQDRSLVEELLEQGDRKITAEEAMQYVKEKLKPHYPPQSAGAKKQKARYSDTNFLLLHALIGNVSGETSAQVIHRMIFDPLGMKQTWFPGYTKPAEELGTPASLWAGDKVFDIPQFLESIYSVYSTNADLILFLRSLFNQKVFDKAETFDLMLAKLNRFGLPLDKAAVRSPGWPIQYGLGIKRFKLPRLFTGFKNIPAAFGHSGSAGTWLFYCPERDLYMAGAVNQVTAAAVPYRIVPKLIGML